MPALEVLVPSDLPPEEVRRRACHAAIKARYGTLAAFAKAIGCSRQQVINVINGRYPMGRGRVAGALAMLTGLDVQVLFPVKEKAA
jgi:hypothetical protein